MPDPNSSAVPFVPAAPQEDSASPAPTDPDSLSEPLRLFEDSFAELIGVKHCIAFASGDAALQAALSAAGIRPEDEIILPAFTAADMPALTGAVFVRADIDPRTYNLDVREAEKHLTKKTKALLPVHMYGYPADMNAVMHLANEHGLTVIEDCSQAPLAEANGVKVGGIGDIGLFAPDACLRAAWLTTNDDDLAEACRRQQTPPSLRQTALLRQYVRRVEEDMDALRKTAAIYAEELESVPVVLPPAPPPEANPVYTRYTIRSERRNDLLRYLQNHQIGCAVCCRADIPLPAAENPEEDFFAHTRQALRDTLSLPMFPELTEEQVRRVCDAVRSFYEEEDAAV